MQVDKARHRGWGYNEELILPESLPSGVGEGETPRGMVQYSPSLNLRTRTNSCDLKASLWAQALRKPPRVQRVAPTGATAPLEKSGHLCCEASRSWAWGAGIQGRSSPHHRAGQSHSTGTRGMKLRGKGFPKVCGSSSPSQLETQGSCITRASCG